MLIDTGSTINLISKKYVYNNLQKFKIYNEKFNFKTATGEHEGNEYVILNFEGNNLKFYLHDFHKQFNLLLSLPTMLDMHVKIDLNKNIITIHNKNYKIQYFENENLVHNIEEIKIRTTHLNPEEKKELYKLVKEYENIFPKETDRLTHTDTIQHRIITKDDIPIYTKPYRYPEIYKKEINEQIAKLLDDQIIQESYSPWSSPIWMVPKKMDASGKRKFRMVIDYRKLNAKTIDDKFPIPNISDILDKLGKNMYYTTLDLTSGFHQIQVHPDSIPKTAFNTDKGHFEFTRMPFGLKNAAGTFQKLMNYVLKDYINKICLVYLDDIIILGTSLQEHCENIRKVFSKLKEHNLKIQLDKSEFMCKEVAYLGHIVSNEGVKPNPAKIEAVKNFPIPKTQKEIKQFLGLLGYYRKFIPNFAKLTKPMTTCLKKGRVINIENKEYRQSFEDSKILLINAPILQYPDFEKQFIVTTDASNFAIGAILSQNINGKDMPIAYASRTLNDHEINYSTTEKELLGIVWAVKYFRPYLYGVKFKIRTDHRPLTWLMSLKDPNSKLMRWRIKLDEYTYEIEYKKGTLNSNADALSRIRSKFEIFKTNNDIFDKPQNLVHCISQDLKLGNGFAKQINEIFNSKSYLINGNSKDKNLLIQPIFENKYKLFHLVTKKNYFDKPTIENIKSCLIKLRAYLIQNDIFEIHMPKICSGLDKIPFEKIESLLYEIFKETHVKIIVHLNYIQEEINVNDETDSIMGNIDEEDLNTVHSADENEINGITYKDSCVNVGLNQVIFQKHNNETECQVLKLFGNKQRFIIKIKETDLKNEIVKIIKEYLKPHINYYCLIDDSLITLINKILQENFAKETYKLIQCKDLLEDKLTIEDQLKTVQNYHLGKTNHRGILETYQKLKRNFYWPNMFIDIQKYINNCDICQQNKYERNPYQIPVNLTQSPKYPFDIVHIDTLTLENKKYLTIIDAFSKFAQLKYIKSPSAIEISNGLIEYFSQYQVPNEIIFDSGTEFNNNLLKELLRTYGIKIHMTCVDNPKSNGLVERFHSTIIEHLRILNQRNNFKELNIFKKIQITLIAYNNSINTITKFTPNEVLFGSEKDNNILKFKDCNEDYLHEWQNKIKMLHEVINKNIQIDKNKRLLKQPQYQNLDNLKLDSVLIKEGKRRIQKIKKPLFKTHKVQEYDPKLRTIRINSNKKHKIDKIKRKRLFVTNALDRDKYS